MGMRQTYVDTSNLSGRTVAGTLRRLLYYVGLHRRHIGIAFVALSLASLLNMVPPWALKIAVDDFIPQKDAAGAARIAGAMMLIYLARGALNYLNRCRATCLLAWCATPCASSRASAPARPSRT